MSSTITAEHQHHTEYVERFMRQWWTLAADPVRGKDEAAVDAVAARGKRYEARLLAG